MKTSLMNHGDGPQNLQIGVRRTYNFIIKKFYLLLKQDSCLMPMSKGSWLISI